MGRVMAQQGGTTEERLLDAAEQLFAAQGYGDTSLRAVTELAGANVAAVNYHYGSKEGLLRAVVGRAMAPINAERDRRLTALYAETGTPAVDEIVRAFVEPSLPLDRGSAPSGLERLIATVLLDPDPRIRQLFADEVDPVEGRYLDALRRALPDRDPELVLVGYTNMIGLLALQQAGTFKGLRLRARTPDTLADSVPVAGTEYLIAFLVAGLTSPS